MAFVAQAADGSTIRYVDGKRYLWLASLTGPLVPIVGVALFFLSGGNPLACVFPLAYTFLFVPLADAIFGEDTHNPPEEVVPAMSRDNYYRVLLYFTIAAAVHAVLRGRVVHRHAFAAVVGVHRADPRHRVLQQRLAPDRARARPQGGSHGSRRRPGRERAGRLRPLLHRAQPRPSRARRHARGHRQLAHGRVDLQVRAGAKFPARSAAAGSWSASACRSSAAGLVDRATRF